MVCVLVGLSASLVMADRVFWNATGKVTEVMGAGFQGLVAADESVEVEFSYDDGAMGTARGGARPLYQTFDFRTDIKLEMEITIGDLSWVGSIDSAPSGKPLTFAVTDVETFFGVAEEMSPTLSSKHGATYSSFPGASAVGFNELEVSFFDEQTFYDGVAGLAFVPVSNPPAVVGINLVSFIPCEFTSADGAIRAGAETISYVIDLESIRMGDGTPPLAPAPFDVSIEWVGADVKLEWAATVDKCYRIQRSDDLEIWDDVIGVVADAVDESYSFEPSGSPGAQYYRIVQTD